MIKKISGDLLEKINPNFTTEEKKWINVFNEIQNRTDILFEGLVSWYSIGVLLQQMEAQGLGNSYELYPTRFKMAIYQSYLFVELHNLIDVKGQSSITSFINYFSEDISKNDSNLKKLFNVNVSAKKIITHFDIFKKWLDNNKEKVNHIKYMRDKNYSHVDHNFVYDNKLSYELMIEMVVFLSDYASLLVRLLNLRNYRVVKGEPVEVKITLMENTPIEVLRIRFRQELSNLVYPINFNKKDKETFILNSYDSVEETLKRLKLIDIDLSNN